MVRQDRTRRLAEANQRWENVPDPPALLALRVPPPAPLHPVMRLHLLPTRSLHAVNGTNAPQRPPLHAVTHTRDPSSTLPERRR